MRTAALLAFAAVSIAAPSLASVPIPGLFNTGRTADNSTVADTGASDAHWAVHSYVAGNSRRPGDLAYYAWNALAGIANDAAWLGDDATSRWLTPVVAPGAAPPSIARGLYSFSLSFDLAGFDPATAQFVGRFATDNRVASVTLNGTPISVAGSSSAGAWTGFSSAGGLFSQSNVLNFVVVNTRGNGVGTGLRVEFLGSTVSPVPEPGVWATMTAGFALVGAGLRRRKARVSHVAA